jgi:hypothetical protein
MNAHTQILPLWAPPNDWAPADLEIPEVTLTPMNARMQTLPLWAPRKDWAPADLEIPEDTNGASLSTGMSLTT